MADQNDWTKKYLDDLNRKLAESRKNQPKDEASRETPRTEKPQPQPPKASKVVSQDKKPEPRTDRSSQRFQKRDPRGPKDRGRADRKPSKDSRDGRKPDRREPVKVPPPKTRTISGTVASVENGHYSVFVEDQKIQCTARETLLQLGPLYAGDQVKIVVHQDQRSVIDRHEPRQNTVVAPSRKGQKNETVLATNVNQVLLVVSVKEPVLRTDWLDRHLVVCEKKGFKPVICCTKIDLADDNGFMEQLDVYRRMGYRILNHSSILPSYMNDLRSLLKGKTTLVTGHVGCGKSELVRSVVAKGLSFEVPAETVVEGVETPVVDEYVETKVVHSYRVEGGIVIDTPGVSEYELYGIPKRDLKKYFRDFRLINNQCASPHCNHVDEPGCKVREAVAQQELSDDRYQNYLKILEGLA